ncbi:hypothetical protein SSP24_72160 [Streptomyces spinoverrucosus]|uniref:Cep192-like domain-containing protein n=1 Tax=Streptomyces spinoverrucosus TaxID=284043 RepID=A0A4Y3VUX7_9ACTN|nr:hypothetical protein [Streptomyces spinoverrucosus]GEC09561.1 hypothetical protein SSP24_72160 [Streptomyces spinoverrucosus]GHB95950.1 hypothetical protein GCM10010397_80760 [Streptomyces spinoverrucosus]
MGVIASLEEKVVDVTPGEVATCQLKLHNTGGVVDQFTLDVLGDAKEWVTVSPQTVSVFPGDDATVEVSFAPPRSAKTVRGETSFAVRVMSREDTDGSAVEEGTVRVGGFCEVVAELVPRTARGSRRGRTKLAVDNLGNTPVTVQFSGVDEEGELKFGFGTRVLTVEGGTTRFVPLKLRPRRRFLRGPVRTHAYRVTAQTADGTKTTVDGSLVQPPILPAGAPKLMLLAGAALAVAAIMGPSFLDPKAVSHAETVADAEDSDSSDSGGSSEDGTPSGGTKPDGTASGDGGSPTGGGSSSEQAGAGASSKSPAGTGGSSDSGGGQDVSAQNDDAPPSVEVQSTEFRMETHGAPGVEGKFTTDSYAVDKGQTLRISDIHLENPHKDKGVVEVRRGKKVLLRFALEDITSKQLLFMEPLQFSEGQKVVYALNCTNSDEEECTSSAYFAGRTIKEAS